MKDIISDIIDILQLESKKKESEFIQDEVLKDFYSEPINKGPMKAKKSAQDNIKIKHELSETKAPLVAPLTIHSGVIPTLVWDKSKFKELIESVSSCAKCELCKSRINPVFGEGNPKAELMIIGEGPGRDEDEQGRPFVGRSGQLLTKMLQAMGFERNDVFIANIVKCRPPANRVPTPVEAQTCLPYLLEQIDVIRPKVLLLLGATPLKYILDLVGITKLHGTWHEFHGIKTIPSFHPAYLLRDPNQKKYAWEDLQKIMQFLGKTPPVKNENSMKN
ncbi:MAG: uracil-DNA glycosylase [Lentisphaerota bacterium]